jgi:tRNA (cytidine/uridine-2'-O-)-methyltransferase
MFNIVLYQPEIPPNTGNIIRLCSNAGAQLHLIHPLGFQLDDRRLRRAGLDYRESAHIREYQALRDFIDTAKPRRLIACSTRGQVLYTQIRYDREDALLFGPETRGLPEAILSDVGAENTVRIPMLAGSRSLNLANSVAVILYEAWRQNGFDGGK